MTKHKLFLVFVTLFACQVLMSEATRVPIQRIMDMVKANSEQETGSDNDNNNDNAFGGMDELSANALSAKAEAEEEMECQDPESDICFKPGYDPDNIPTGFFNIWGDYYITEIEEVNDATTTLTVKGVFGLSWYDGDATLSDYYVANVSSYKILKDHSPHFQPRLMVLRQEEWIPLVLQETYNFLVIHTWYSDKSRNMLLNLEGKFRVGCPMDFSNFPFDTQRCMFSFEMYDLTVDSAMMIVQGVDYSKDKQKPLQYEVSVEDVTEKEDMFNIWLGSNYSRAAFWIVLERKSSSLVLQFIMPSGMFVLCSWISFVMPIDGGERAGLLVTLFLVLISMYLAAVEIAPKADTINGLEAWLIGSIVFVFLSLLEYSVAMILDLTEDNNRVSSEKAKMVWAKLVGGISGKKIGTKTDPKPKEVQVEGKPVPEEEGEKKKPLKAHKKLDYASLAIFPILFIFFNIAYWESY